MADPALRYELFHAQMAVSIRDDYDAGQPVTVAYQCKRCGALVVDQEAHTAYHEKVDGHVRSWRG